MSDQVILFDTTLRDGEQALRASLTVKEKLQIALALERLGIDVMEVGFPVSSPGDFESVKTIASTIKHSRVCGLARALKQDIDAAAEALSVADAFRIHTFISTSEIHVRSKLKRTFDEVIDMGVAAIKHARRYTDDVEFSCEDAGRTNIDNLCRIVEAAIDAGATTINIPDTVGYTLPDEFGGIITNLKNRVPNIDKAILSVHCHDDLGLSVANSIAAINAGARQVEGTINGLGERAGNCALEEVAMILKTRGEQMNAHTTMKHQEIYRTSQMISQLCNMPIQPNKAIVGSNAFAHSSGIHQDGVLKAKNTYEIITPETIGLAQNDLNLTSRSGRHVIKHRMTDMGYTEQDYDLDTLYADFLKLADKKGQVFDYDLEALVHFNLTRDSDDYYHLDYLGVQSGSGIIATASVRLQCGDEFKAEAATGNGPVDALYQTINRITGIELDITNYQISAKGKGKNALGQVDIVAVYKSQRYHGVGLATDIVESSGLALVNVLNHVYRAEQIAKKKQQKLAEKTHS